MSIRVIVNGVSVSMKRVSVSMNRARCKNVQNEKVELNVYNVFKCTIQVFILERS